MIVNPALQWDTGSFPSPHLRSLSFSLRSLPRLRDAPGSVVLIPTTLNVQKKNNLFASRCSQQSDVACCRNHNFWKKRLLLSAGGSDFKFTHCRENSYVVFCRIVLRTRPNHYVKSAFQCSQHGGMFFLTCGHSSRTLKGGSHIMIWVCSSAT